MQLQAMERGEFFNQVYITNHTFSLTFVNGRSETVQNPHVPLI